MTDDRASLLSLPVELMTFVTDGILPSDLLNLRLTCRDIAAKTHDVFLRVHFTQKCFMISNKASMTALLRLSENQSIAGSVKQLLFLSTRLVHFREDELTTRALDSCTAPSRTERRRETTSFKEAYAALRAEETAFVGEGRVGLLTDILRNFQNAGSNPNVNFLRAELGLNPFRYNAEQHKERLQGFLDRHRPWGYQTLTKAFKTPAHSYIGVPTLRWNEQPPDRERWVDYAHVYEAIVDSGFPIQELSLGERLIPLRIQVLLYKEASFKPHFLHTLKLFCCAGEQQSIGRRGMFSRPGLRALVNFLVSAQNLEHLALGISPGSWWGGGEKDHGALFRHIATMKYPDGTPIDVEADAQLLPKLKSLKLEHHRFLDLATLLTFLREHKETLMGLTLSRIYADGHIPWQSIHQVELDKPMVVRSIKEAVGVAEKEGFDLNVGEVFFGTH